MHKKGILISVFVSLVALIFFFRSAPPSPIYYVKEVRESLQSLFVFGDEDRAYWLLTLSDKRLDEALSLNQRNMDFLARSQFKKALNYQNEAENLIKSLKDKTNTTYLEEKLNGNREKEKSLSLMLN